MKTRDWTTAKLPPLTVEEIEGHLDYVAGLMSRMGSKAHLLLPVWRRLERELHKQREADAAIAAALARLTRSKGGSAAQA